MNKKIWLVINRYVACNNNMMEQVLKAFSNKEMAEKFKEEVEASHKSKLVNGCLYCPMTNALEEANMAPKTDGIKSNILSAIESGKKCSRFKERKEFGYKEKFTLFDEKGIDKFLSHRDGFANTGIVEEQLCENYTGKYEYEPGELGEIYLKKVDFIDE